MADASEEQRECLLTTYDAGVQLIRDRVSDVSSCLLDEECDPRSISKTPFTNTASEAIPAECSPLEDMIALSKTAFVERAHKHTDCILSTIHPDTRGLDLSCGPSNAEFDAEREEWTQVIVDGEKWGTLCGDGSDYAFYIKWAPEGEALDNLLIGLQGGGFLCQGGGGSPPSSSSSSSQGVGIPP